MMKIQNYPTDIIETSKKIVDMLNATQQMNYIGEAVSQLEHSLQAAFFAEQAGYSDEVILASLLHDVGHFCYPKQQLPKMAGLGILHHEKIGQQYLLANGFSEKIADLVASHVASKRYLTAKKPKYYQKLSAASKQTLEFQGGPMSDNELIEFEQHPWFRERLQVRVVDEKAKEIDLNVPGLVYYLPLIQKALLQK